MHASELQVAKGKDMDPHSEIPQSIPALPAAFTLAPLLVRLHIVLL